MLANLYNYWAVVVLMLGGLYIVIAHDNLIKKIIGLNIFQTSVFILFISLGRLRGGTAPIETAAHDSTVYSNPLPHVLILTAIVVGVATTSLGLALVIRIREAYGSIEEDEILAWQAEDTAEGEATELVKAHEQTNSNNVSNSAASGHQP